MFAWDTVDLVRHFASIASKVLPSVTPKFATDDRLALLRESDRLLQLACCNHGIDVIAAVLLRERLNTSASDCFDHDSDLAYLSGDDCRAYEIVMCSANAIDAAIAATSRDWRKVAASMRKTRHWLKQQARLYKWYLDCVRSNTELYGTKVAENTEQSNESWKEGQSGTRNIVVFLDGTWNTFEQEGPLLTNVHRLFHLTSTQAQVKLYLPGVGVHQGLPYRFIYGLTGKGVFRAARLAWDWVASNYRLGDRIFILGFSRGAFAARHLASMIVRQGVDGHPERGFKQWLSDVRSDNSVTSVQGVHFLGLFDCVPGNRLYQWRDQNRRLVRKTLEPGIAHFRHAVSHDERRWSFRPIVYQSRPSTDETSFIQMWFPGFHSDVGGGSGVENGLAELSYCWMLREAFSKGLLLQTIRCDYHGGRRRFVPHFGMNPVAPGTVSDYITTRLGLRWNRKRHETAPAPIPTMRVSELVVCPFCKEKMFS